MELTQKIECTQELYANNLEKEIPDQIGFLGICGVKHPLKKGPNKIGRDPDTCNIVLNLNSISRQHAVINILNSYDFMLMDLDSANKTKVADKTLQAYIPTPLKNGDMIQFGQVFGVFRLFEECNDLPMTQALDIPETPVRNQHVSKLNLITTIPESPEVSDRDDSFIVATQPKPTHVFKSPKTNFIKSSGKTITIKPVGSNKIDNVYWNSSKKSDSFSLETDTFMKTDTLLHTSKIKENIHENDTQVHNKTSNFIYEADTQVEDNIASIYNIETQLPKVDNLPEVHKVHGEENVDIHLFTENKENDNNIYNSETQDVLLVKDVNEESNNPDTGSNKNDISDDIILFDEIENPALDESFESQALSLPELEAIDQIEPTNEGKIEITDKNKQNIPISNRRDSGSSTDCEEDLVLTQNIPERRINEDDSTDCEDVKELDTNNEPVSNLNIDDNLTDCEDEIISSNRGEKKKIDINLEDLATQIIEEIPSHITTPTTSKIIPCLEDLPTQIIDEDKNCRKENNDQLDFEDLPTQVLPQESQNIISEQATPFKVPVISPFKRKRKDQTELIPNKGGITDNVTKDIDSDDEEKYYAATQELLNDLCTQRELSPEIVSFAGTSKNISKVASDNDKTNTDFKVTEDIDEKIDQFVMNLTNSMIKDVEIEKEVAPLKKVSSDSSDFESTPKKLHPHCFLETKLPSTQEIKNYLKQSGYQSSESSKGSDTDCSNSGSPLRKKTRKVVKRDLTTKFENEEVEERVVTRVRKPTPKMQNAIDSKKNSDKIRQARSLEIDNNVEKVASISTFTSNKEKSKKKTSKTDSKKSNVSQEINKINENNKSRENNKTQANKRSKESIKIQESLKSKENNNPEEKKHVQESTKSKSRQKRHEKNNNENNSHSNENEKKSEPKSTRISSKTKDKQNIVQKGDSHVKDITDEVIPQQTEATKKRNGSTRNKTNRKSNTIDKYLFSTPVEKIQNDETKTIEKRSSRSKNQETTNTGAIVETDLTTDKRSNRSKNKETTNHGAIVETDLTTDKRSSRSKNKETTNHGAIVETDLTTEKRSSRSKNKETTNHGAILETELTTEKRSSRSKNKETTNHGAILETELTTEKRSSRSKNKETTNHGAIVETDLTKEKRSSRSKNKETTNHGAILETELTTETRSSRSKNKETTSNGAMFETEVRRSKRQRTAKKSFETMEPSNPKQSAVYNISSESGTDSPNKLKRQASNFNIPIAKKSKITNSSNVILRSTPARKLKTHYVLFTAFPCDEVKVKLEKLGAVVVSDIMQCTVVLTLQIKRTFKLLCAVGLGKPIVGPNWVQACVDTNMIVDPWLYLIKDELTEKRFQFNLERILLGNRQFLKGYNVSSTPNIMPSPPEMKLIVECSGGSWTTGGKNWICVSSSSDKSLWKSLKRKGATIVSTEFILGGVLRQTTDIQRNTLA